VFEIVRVQRHKKLSAMQPSLSIIIPVYNGGPAFRRSLDSVVAHADASVEIIVVVDGGGARDESEAYARQLGAHVLCMPHNRGPARARNVGAQVAKGEILFFVDADVTIQADTIALVQQMFRLNSDLDALIGSYDDQPGAANFLSQYKNLLHHYTHQQAREEASTFWGACGAIRRSLFLAMGGFNEAYRYPSIEDIELGYRLRAAGHRIRLCKHIQVKHLKRWGVRSLLKAEVSYRALPWTELIWRDRNFVSDLNLDTSSRLSVVSVYGGASAVIASVMGWTVVWPLVCFFTALLLLLNAPVYQFFHRKRGFWFSLQVLPWHWFYYGYSGYAFVVGSLRYWLNFSTIPPISGNNPLRVPELLVLSDLSPEQQQRGLTPLR
jgi:GT2 family glycosyltransferase